MRARVTKIFRFDAAHKLPNHNGKCHDLHGHTYKVEITCEGHICKDPDSPKLGMVVDFDTLKDVWNEIKPVLDHKYLNDTLQMTTTAENIAAFICSCYLGHNFSIHSVRVWETESCYAEVTGAEIWANGHETTGSGNIRSHHSG